MEARLLRWLTLLWLCLGFAILYSASYNAGLTEAGDGLRYVKVQSLWIGLGLLGFTVLSNLPLRYAMSLGGFGVLGISALILVTLLPGVGVTVNGSTRWLGVGPFLVQPSELIKPFLILQAAYLFGRWQSLHWQIRALWLGIFLGVVGAILVQPNLSTAVVCSITVWLIALAAGLPYSRLGLTAAFGVGVSIVSVSIKAYQRQRIVSFINPWADPIGHGYQLVQSLLAIGSGGLWGQGFGLSQQKISHLPIEYTDFIFSVYAEEFGFAGSLALLLLLATYASLVLWVSLRTKHLSHRLIAVGGTVFLVGQSLLNIGVASGALPTTGLPFPLLSYGGSSMISNLMIAGLLVRVAREHQGDVVLMPRSRPDIKP
ncbi:MAG: FtsW/RodA/SpoVE family cell cycle protein [Cyanobacteria bacterium P01_D01_bin.128]